MKKFLGVVLSLGMCVPFSIFMVNPAHAQTDSQGRQPCSFDGYGNPIYVCKNPAGQNSIANCMSTGDLLGCGYYYSGQCQTGMQGIGVNDPRQVNKACGAYQAASSCLNNRQYCDFYQALITCERSIFFNNTDRNTCSRVLNYIGQVCQSSGNQNFCGWYSLATQP
jgi:hypothetical protein